ncbi:hypothetical protein ACFTXM_43810 [Streptomyces sp. NPDC056930]|uniref:hypothetical protein n=1 Tax=Streptomyces sp. NPDC056930 TaxID=3345967 RepID=UPI0036412D57
MRSKRALWPGIWAMRFDLDVHVTRAHAAVLNMFVARTDGHAYFIDAYYGRLRHCGRPAPR